ncbi:MAG: hypothetical protein V1914_00325 [archaeon]
MENLEQKTDYYKLEAKDFILGYGYFNYVSRTDKKLEEHIDYITTLDDRDVFNRELKKFSSIGNKVITRKLDLQMFHASGILAGIYVLTSLFS